MITEEKERPRIIALLSPVGGIGKSTLALHLAQMLARREKKTLLIDASASAALDLLLGVGESVVYTATDVANGLCSAFRAILEREGMPLVSLMPAAVGEPLGEAMLPEVVKGIKAETSFDFIVIDAAPSLYTDVKTVSDTVILLTDPRESSLRAAEAYASLCGEIDFFALTFASFSREGAEREACVIDMVDQLSLPLIGVLPYTPRIRTVDGIPHRSAYEAALFNLSSRLMGERVPLLKGVPLEGMDRRAFIERQGKKEV